MLTLFEIWRKEAVGLCEQARDRREQLVAVVELDESRGGGMALLELARVLDRHGLVARAVHDQRLGHHVRQVGAERERVLDELERDLRRAAFRIIEHLAPA